MPQLDQPRHEMFARLVAQGASQTAAYMEVYPDSTEDSANANASRLLTVNDSVRARIAEITRQLTQNQVLTLARKRELLREMAEGQRPTRTQTMPDGGEKKTFDMLGATELDAKVAGELAQDTPHGPVVVNISLQRMMLEPASEVIELEAAVQPTPNTPV